MAIYTSGRTAKTITGLNWININNLRRKSNVYVPSKGTPQIYGADKKFTYTTQLAPIVCKNFAAQDLSGFNPVLGIDYPDIIPLEATITEVVVYVKAKSSTGLVKDALQLITKNKTTEFIPGTNTVPKTYSGDTSFINDRIWRFSGYTPADFNNNDFTIKYKKVKSQGILHVDAILIMITYEISTNKFFIGRDLDQETYENTYCQDIYQPLGYTIGKTYSAGSKGIYAYNIHNFNRSITNIKPLNKKIASMYVSKTELTSGCGTTIYGTYFDFSLGIFKIKTDGSGYTVLKNNLNAGLHKASLDLNSYIFGTTNGDGSGNGYIWKVGTDGNNYTVVKNFSSTINYFTPMFYYYTLGVTGNYIWGGANPTIGNGFLYQIKPDASGYNVPKTLNGTTEGSKILGLISGYDQISGQFIEKIYGLTDKIIFSINYNGTGFTIIKSLPTGLFFKSLSYGSLFAIGKVDSITPNKTKLFAVVTNTAEQQPGVYPTLHSGCGLVSVNLDGTDYTNYYNLNYYELRNLIVSSTKVTGTCSTAGEFNTGFTFTS